MRRLRLRRPSPSLAISLIALFVALGGTSYAAIKIGAHNLRTGSVGTRAVKNGTLRGRDIRRATLSGREVNERRLGVVPVAEGSSHFAVVRGVDGGASRSRGVISSTRSTTGRYQVIFNRDVRGCAYNANLGQVDASNPNDGEIGVSQLNTNVNGVAVRTTTSSGALANRSFHLVVIC